MLDAERARALEKAVDGRAVERARPPVAVRRRDPHEQLDCLALVTTPWTVDNGFITPTFKVKRNHIEEVYGVSYTRWIGTRRKIVWEGD